MLASGKHGGHDESRDKDGWGPRSRTCTTMVFMGSSLGILEDNLPINTHYIGLI